MTRLQTAGLAVALLAALAIMGCKKTDTTNASDANTAAASNDANATATNAPANATTPARVGSTGPGEQSAPGNPQPH